MTTKTKEPETCYGFEDLTDPDEILSIYLPQRRALEADILVLDSQAIQASKNTDSHGFRDLSTHNEIKAKADGLRAELGTLNGAYHAADENAKMYLVRNFGTLHAGLLKQAGALDQQIAEGFHNIFVLCRKRAEIGLKTQGLQSRYGRTAPAITGNAAERMWEDEPLMILHKRTRLFYGDLPGSTQLVFEMYANRLAAYAGQSRSFDVESFLEGK